MKRIVTLLFIFTFSVTLIQAQCDEENGSKVLLIGDSWGFFMNSDQTINNVFKKWGHSNYKYLSNLTLVENGSETSDFLQSDKQDEIEAQLFANPSIKAVHVSLGGNDVIGDWNTSFTQFQTDSIREAVQGRLEQVIQFILNVRPDVQVVWSGYTYPNFEETIKESPIGEQAHVFYGTWQDMGFPIFRDLNDILNDFSGYVEDYADTNDRVAFVPASGILQYTFGQTTPLAVAPGGTYPPFTVPLPEGDPDYPSPIPSLRDYGIFIDSYHLSAQGYFDLVDYTTRKFYHKFLMDDLYLLSEGGSRDGSVSSTGNVSTDLRLGESFGEEHATILSFNTTGMADTTLAKASLFLRRESLDGANPVNNNLQVKIINGKFGSTVDVEAADYAATGDASENPCQYGSKDEDTHWIRLDIPTGALPAISNDSITQFIISAPGFTGGTITFTDASDPEFAPILNLDYGTPASIKESEVLRKSIKIYPNPTSGMVMIDRKQTKVNSGFVSNILGERVMESNLQGNYINLEDLPDGVYILTLNTDAGIVSKRIIKR